MRCAYRGRSRYERPSKKLHSLVAAAPHAQQLAHALEASSWSPKSGPRVGKSGFLTGSTVRAKHEMEVMPESRETLAARFG
jgi:hypothetical protein